MSSDLNLALDYQLVTLDAALATYLSQAFIHLSPKTRHWHASRLHTFLAGIDTARPALSVSIVDIAYALHQINNHTPPYAVSYRHSISRAVRYYFRWLASSGILPADPTTGLRLPRLPRAGRKGLTDRDALAILNTCQPHTFHGVRDYALLKLLETTGARLAGLAALSLSDLHLDSPDPHLQRRIILHEKFEKERTAFMTPSAQAALQRWLAIRPNVSAKYTLDKVFTSKAGYPLTTRAVDMLIRRRAAHAGVFSPCSAHQWRHRFARQLAERGLPLGQIAQLMGHTDVSITVDYYGIFAVSELQDGYDKYMQDVDCEMSSPDIAQPLRGESCQ